MLTLDVGCGESWRGTVNLDIQPYPSNPNFILGDALHLPFRDKAFRKVYCFHVIEHVLNPYALLHELIRVCRGTLEIRCPHRLSKVAKQHWHRNYFTRTWFIEALKDQRIDMTITRWSPMANMLGLISLPDEIRVKVHVV